MSSKELRKSFNPSYFSIEDILASQTRVPCQTRVPINNFGEISISLIKYKCQYELWKDKILHSCSQLSLLELKLIHFVFNLGFLDPSQESQDLPSASQIELPLWAANPMSSQKRGFVSVKLPKYYGEKFRWVCFSE